METLEELNRELERHKEIRNKQLKKIKIARESQKEMRDIEIKRRQLKKEINDLKNPKLRIAKGIFSQIGKDLKRTVNTGVKAGKLINQDLSRRKRERELSEIKIRKTQARIRKRRRVKSQSRGKR